MITGNQAQDLTRIKDCIEVKTKTLVLQQSSALFLALQKQLKSEPEAIPQSFSGISLHYSAGCHSS